MLAHTKKHPTEAKTVSLCFQVHLENIDKIRDFIIKLEPETEHSFPVSADEFYQNNFAGQTRPSIHLKGLRCREGLTQRQLAEKTGIKQNHISEMENGKRSIGKELAHKLAHALNTDYRMLL